MGPRGDRHPAARLDRRSRDRHPRATGAVERNTADLHSDNGPVLDDGYADQARELVGEHRPTGTLRGGKYSIFEAGPRVPTMLRWPEVVEAGSVSEALVAQVDFLPR